MLKREQLEELERALHAHAVQAQGIRAQLAEAETALAQLSDGAYRIIGNLMVKVQPDAIRPELEGRKNALHTRLASLEREEAKLKTRFEKLQHEVLEEEHGKV